MRNFVEKQKSRKQPLGCLRLFSKRYSFLYKLFLLTIYFQLTIFYF